jgi:hypothetical protein
MKKSIAVAAIAGMVSVAAFAQIAAPQVQVTTPKVTVPQVQVTAPQATPQIAAPRAQASLPLSVMKQDASMAPAQNSASAGARGKHKGHRPHHHKKAMESNGQEQ